jgi:hypothetical protein
VFEFANPKRFELPNLAPRIKNVVLFRGIDLRDSTATIPIAMMIATHEHKLWDRVPDPLTLAASKARKDSI